MAEDTRLHLDYYINVCSGYFPGNAKYQCQGSAGIGGCQVDSVQKKAHNMGYVMSGPVISSAGHLTLRYLGGETCHHRYDRSTRINFFCSHVHGSPVFMAETEDCEYVFNWKTPSACAVEKYSGEKCVVYDENYGFYYDLSSLTDIYSYDIEGNIEYKVRFCGKKPTICGKEVDSCLLKGKSATDLLNFDSMKYDDGKVVFTYNSTKFTVRNEISCDPKVETISGVGKTEISAGYNILWTSKLVCPPVTGEECSITHESDLYDLSVLAKEEWNWLARNNIKEFGFKGYQFHFSVCKPLKNISRFASDGSRGAMENKIEGTFTSLGTMIAPLKFSNGYLTMTYGHGDEIQGRCKNPTTTIQFVCDDVVPEGVGVAPVVDGFDKTTCEFHVTWLTRAACPVRSLLDWSNIPCTAIHPATKKTIDLRPLNNSKDGYYEVKDQDGNQYKINVCGSAKGCSKNSGICKIGKPNVNVGSVNTTLVYRQGFLFLHYKNGENCEGQQNRKTETLISFMCDPQAGNGKPALERTNDCTHFVTWKTKLACEAEVDCVAHDGQQFYDLTPLIKNDANYEVVHREKTYLINVCRSLVSGSRCPANATVCKDGESFGHVSSPPTIGSGETDVKAQLVYKNGRCGGSGNTTINFLCDPEDLANKQIIVFADKCSLTISWWTSLVCPKKVANNNCVFSDPEQKFFCFDLKKLGRRKSATFPGGDVHFHICSDHGKDCGEANGEACLTIGDKNTKALQRKGINYTGQEVRISYEDDIVLVLYCGEDGNSNTPQYIGKYKVDDKTTKYFFNMVTPEVCPPRKLPCEVKYNGKTFNLAGLSEKNFQVKGKDNDLYLVSICGHIQYTKETKICSSRATAVKISREKKEQSTIVIAVDRDYTLQYKKTDTDYPIHLQYSSSEAICDGKKAKVLHKFKCNHGTNPPQFDSFKDCVYTFLWQTAEACAEKRYCP
ncbi:cation-independent mannose-6-phosphate receptor-like [Paramuricea clavata]|uniref:Cation-independent mannose-6-phosphate receptor-like n=1 Tax=Paramuricea clavata TaxID=317549 RepID=A0A7D9EXB5_PARCT|nr:cation-independent mannose-6-phosphate receptor-like [Paramuricea clavata]